MDIEKIARQCGVIDHIDCSDDLFVPARVEVEDILAFGEAVREACAKVCDERAANAPIGSDEQCEAEDCAFAIRERGAS